MSNRCVVRDLEADQAALHGDPGLLLPRASSSFSTPCSIVSSSIIGHGFALVLADPPITRLEVWEPVIGCQSVSWDHWQDPVGNNMSRPSYQCRTSLGKSSHFHFLHEENIETHMETLSRIPSRPSVQFLSWKQKLERKKTNTERRFIAGDKKCNKTSKDKKRILLHI